MAFGRGARAWLATALTLGIAAAAGAQENDAAIGPLPVAVSASGWYVSGGVGVSRYRVSNGQDGHETLIGHGGKLMVGYQFRRSLRLEAGAVSLGSDWRTGPAIALVGAIHLGDHVALLGRIGAYYRRTARSESFFGFDTREQDEKGTEPTLGIGVEWYLQPRLSALLEVESYESQLKYIFDETRGANMTTLSLRYRF
ncbi:MULTISPECIES: outer membrane beta-barrel protein [unclassified Rhizobacter]|uniref:outer membrane beta-barrel protein n=1 Tax=unclassified Rhizobacter TaxID=2640088 RepID=UPI0009E742CF|nr:MULTISPECIES: outer membrane beta-barrel protein [unclassified Rhizobacter]